MLVEERRVRSLRWLSGRVLSPSKIGLKLKQHFFKKILFILEGVRERERERGREGMSRGWGRGRG